MTQEIHHSNEPKDKTDRNLVLFAVVVLVINLILVAIYA